MDRFGTILKRLRGASGFSQAEVAARLTALGTPFTDKAVSKWEQGATKPDALTFLRLCELYGVRDPYGVFIDSRADLNALGLQRLKEYSEFLRSDTRFVERAVELAVAPEAEPPRAPKRMIRLYDMPASAGAGVFLDYADFIDIEIDDSVPYDADYALRISGDSMEPTFENGQIVYVRKQETLNLGEIGIFVLNSEVYCKEFGRRGLISHNPEYYPISVSEYDAFYIFGKVVK
ncbi:MAG: helix-turn-helix domain-containing protein [Oscillospiraceae bacterium]|nr:helix-turn-helix domain-containing protein [Oscillospiraceae bacterium]